MFENLRVRLPPLACPAQPTLLTIHLNGSPVEGESCQEWTKKNQPKKKMQDNIGISFRDAVPGPDVPVKILQVNDLFADNRDKVMKMKKDEMIK